MKQTHPPYSRLFAVFVSVTLPLLAQAQETQSTANVVTSVAPPDLGGSILQMLFSLFFVLALLIGGLYLLKKISNPRSGTSNLLRVIAATTVGTRERVVVVEVADTWLVLGVAPGQITRLHQLPADKTSLAAQSQQTNQDFAHWLNKIMAQRNAK